MIACKQVPLLLTSMLWLSCARQVGQQPAIAVPAPIPTPCLVQATDVRKLDAKDKTRDIERLLTAANFDTVVNTMFDQVQNSMRKSGAMFPEEFWQTFRSNFTDGFMEQIVVPLYDKHFSHEEIKTLTDFYETSTGKNIIKKMPVLTAESYKVGADWGQLFMQRFVNQWVQSHK